MILAGVFVAVLVSLAIVTIIIYGAVGALIHMGKALWRFLESHDQPKAYKREAYLAPRR